MIGSSRHIPYKCHKNRQRGSKMIADCYIPHYLLSPRVPHKINKRRKYCMEQPAIVEFACKLACYVIVISCIFFTRSICIRVSEHRREWKAIKSQYESTIAVGEHIHFSQTNDTASQERFCKSEKKY